MLLETQGGGLGGKTFKSLGKLSNDWTDWHQLWFTSADSYGKLGMDIGLIQFAPQYPGAFGGGGLWGHKFKSGKAAKRLDRLAPNLVHVSGFIWEWK